MSICCLQHVITFIFQINFNAITDILIVIRHEGGYLYAEYRSKLMRFVDDVEFFYDGKAGLIHVRSASRLGRRDFGVNRARVEALRARIEGKAKA